MLTISIHEYGDVLPRHGRARRSAGVRGARAARSTCRCRPAPATTGGSTRSAPSCRAPSRAFDPDVLVTQLGCDTHHTDPLAHLELTTAAYREAARDLHALAHDVAGGRWVATGGGGYQWARVVPRAWTLCVRRDGRRRRRSARRAARRRGSGRAQASLGRSGARPRSASPRSVPRGPTTRRVRVGEAVSGILGG